jgi:glycosyltransferase involved in cell wall biosynthesis
MTVHFYTKEPIERPASRQRAFLVANELVKRGVPARVHAPAVESISETPWPQKGSLILAVVRSLWSIKKGDVVFLQRTISNKYFFIIMVLYLKLFRRKMIFDFDDAVYIHSAYKTKMFVRMADAVFVCSTLLRDWVRPYNANVHIFHTSLNAALYQGQERPQKQSDACVIGWIGKGEEHVENLKLVREALAEVFAQNTTSTFQLVGAWKDKRIYDLFSQFPRERIELIDFIDWHTIPQVIAGFDIGLMPLVDRSEWNRSRSCYKLFEYLAVGIPTVSSSNGEILNVIQDGQNGLLADTPQEWAEKILMLLDDAALRTRLGHAGQEYLRQHESYEAIVPRMIAIMHSL